MAHFSARQLKHFMRFWPPLLGAGVKIEEFTDDGTQVVVTHKPNMLTKNAMGVAFGGTMSAMTDPFFMLASMHRMGKGYRIWDTAGEIEFRKPGRGKLTADMRIPNETYKLIEEKTAGGDKYLHWFDVDIVDEEGDVVAHVRRQVYYRKKQDKNGLNDKMCVRIHRFVWVDQG